MDKAYPKCSCGQESTKKAFSTFEYYYCTSCKTEVEPKDTKPIQPLHELDKGSVLPPLWGVQLQGVLPTPPPGFVATAGEYLTCSFCGGIHGALKVDLPDGGSSKTRFHSGTGTYISFNSMGSCCLKMSFDRYNAFLSYNEFHIKDRGWV